MTIPLPSSRGREPDEARERSPEAVAAFEAMFRAHYVDVCAYVRGMVRSSAVAEELAQDVFAKIWERLNIVDAARNERAYLMIAAKRLALNYLTREGLAARYMAAQDRGEPEDPVSIEEDVVDRDLEARVRAAAEAMPPQMRKVWRLRREGGMTYEEIARAMGLSVKTVERHMGKAFRRMRASLAGVLVLTVAFLGK